MKKDIPLWVAIFCTGAAIAIAIFIGGYFLGMTAYAATHPPKPLVVVSGGPWIPLVSDQALREAPISTTTATALIWEAAMRWGVNFERLLGTLRCESRLGQYQVGDGGTSLGIAQIHFPTSWAITKQQAMDAAFSIDFAAQKFAAGLASHWTCYRILYGSGAG